MERTASETLILIVENNRNQAQLIEEVLRDDAAPHQILVLNDGVEAINYLHQREPFLDAARPDLILLDLNLPQKDGREVLAEIKADARLKRIPTVVLTASDDEADIFKSYELQGNCYVIKSSDLEQLAIVVRKIKEFWLGVVTLPSQ